MAKVLIIDDMPEIRTLLGAAVEQAGHRALLASDAEDAHRKLDQDPDVLFADIDLPGQNGIEFSQATRKIARFAHIPVVFITANPDAEKLVHDTGLTETTILQKPFRFADVAETMRQILH